MMMEEQDLLKCWCTCSPEVMVEAHWCASFQVHPRMSRWESHPGELGVAQIMSLESTQTWHDLETGLTVH
ncbi:hypothetical protein Cfor_02443 [Coptotermes formosanus]|uniref:Uncharacterized protein n=1 Tax=Coptotermes formosanus TaxID=36987 RepID=A0A6L2PQ64_COPFO|nr:hypothetical protein Cfor_02443 [Coptotermes formosanus]